MWETRLTRVSRAEEMLQLFLFDLASSMAPTFRSVVVYMLIEELKSMKL
jgi:hypothetical protein